MLDKIESKIVHKDEEDEPLTEKLPESIESSRFVSHRERMSGEFDSRKDSQSKKFEQSLKYL